MIVADFRFTKNFVSGRKKNVFVKPNEQRQACLYYVMARKGARKRTFVLWFPDADFLSKSCRLNKRQS